MGEVLSGPGSRVCAHSVCTWPASSTLSFEYDARRSWLEDLKPEAQPSTYDLCAVHAGRFRPPKGWTHEDMRRMPEPVMLRRLDAEPEVPRADTSTAHEIALPEI